MEKWKPSEDIAQTVKALTFGKHAAEQKINKIQKILDYLVSESTITDPENTERITELKKQIQAQVTNKEEVEEELKKIKEKLISFN